MLTGLIALGIFATILMLLHGCAALHRQLVRRGTDRAIERIQKWSTPEVVTAPLEIVRKESLSEIPWLSELLGTLRHFQPLRVLHQQAASPLPLGFFVLATLLMAMGAFVFTLSMQPMILLALLCGALGGALPAGYLAWRKRRRVAMFERQLPDALDLISRALKAGHAFSTGLKLVADEAADPVGTEFKRAFDEVSMGIALPQALQNMTERLDCVDLRFFVTSVGVQRETGGNLAEIIDMLASLIRKRFELQMKVRALSAEGRFSAFILFFLPLFLGAALFKMNPDYMSTLFTDPAGKNLVVVGSFLMVTGAIIMKRMVMIKV